MKESPVYVMPSWPRGFCPLHCFEGLQCNKWCWPVRVKFATLARDFDVFWRTPAGKAHYIVRDAA